jgi:hypothetical protein
MKVRQMIGSAGNPVANQFIIRTNEQAGAAEYFQSYESIIAKKSNEGVTLDEYYWNYSRTTSKYRSMFLGESTKETQAKIDSGEYKLANLN